MAILTKYFCDRCKKEVSPLECEKQPFYFKNSSFSKDLCKECGEEYFTKYKKLCEEFFKTKINDELPF
ncbi:hypothetical protein [uncultured Clostridium sp.]|uniref:hypothetical protein n=1 Tax=uncultured Clostridium sp. TaxID=59620 RepID=UPI002731255D|nr:hypothetical protein [uncultured Clostridium sp.]